MDAPTAITRLRDMGVPPRQAIVSSEAEQRHERERARARAKTVLDESQILDVIPLEAAWITAMTAVAWGRDQPGVAARAEALGVAHVVERDALTPETLGGAIRAVLENPSYAERARYHGERLRAESPPAKVRELVSAFMAERAQSKAG